VTRMPATLLDSHIEQLEASGKGLKTMTRMCLIGRLAPGSSAAAFSSWCETALAPAGGSITGLLLLLPDGWVQTIEGPQEEVPGFVRSLRDCTHLAASRVLSAQEDVRSRYFPHWSSAEASVQRSNYAEIEADGVPALLADTVIAMLKIGKKITSDGASPKAAKDLVSRWESNFTDCMPSNERLAQLFELEGLPTLIDFLDIFDSHVDVVMEGETIWPPERPQVY